MAVTVTKSYKLDDLKSRILNVAQTSNFQCWVDASSKSAIQKWINQKFNENPEVLRRKTIQNIDLENISLTCCEASLPGSSFLTHDVNVYTGVTERFAYTRAYDDRADFTFYVDDQYLQLKYFEYWMTYVADEQKNSTVRGGVDSPTYNYRMNFPDNYRVDAIRISKFERDFGGLKTQNDQPKSKLTYVFKDAYPISMNSIPVSYDSSEVLKCTVSFTYSRYYLEENSLGKITPPNTKPSTNNPAAPASPPATITPARSGQSQPTNTNTIGQ